MCNYGNSHNSPLGCGRSTLFLTHSVVVGGFGWVFFFCCCFCWFFLFVLLLLFFAVFFFFFGGGGGGGLHS